MNYIWLTILCLFIFLTNVAFDKLGSNKVSGILIATIKSSLCSLFVLIYVLIIGEGVNLFKFESTSEVLYTIFFGACQACTWFFYFFAMKRSKIESFTSFNECTFLFFANVATLFFSFSYTINGESAMSFVVYFLGLASCATGSIIVATNKHLRGESFKWIILDIVADVTGGVLTVGCSKTLARMNAAVSSFYTLFFLAVTGIIICLIMGTFKEVKKMEKSSFIFISVGALLNAVYFVLRQAINKMDGVNIAIVNAIIASYFLIITFINAVIKKEKFPRAIWACFFMMILGMILCGAAYYF